MSKEIYNGTSNYSYTFSQCDRKSIQIYYRKTTDKRKWLIQSNSGLIAKLFEDEITDNPFDIIFANLEQCTGCNFIEGEIERNNCMRGMMWDADWHKLIRLESLVWGYYCCNLETKSDEKFNYCDANRYSMESLLLNLHLFC